MSCEPNWQSSRQVREKQMLEVNLFRRCSLYPEFLGSKLDAALALNNLGRILIQSNNYSYNRSVWIYKIILS
jgi:hypothetical protein